MHQRNRCRAEGLATALAFLVMAACGKDGSGSTAPAAPVVSSVAVSAGDGQTARIGAAITVSPAVVVRDQRGAVMAGVSVAFSVASGGGTLTGNTALTDGAGSASAGVWTLGSAPGPNTLRVQVNGGTNPSVTISATARLPFWTVMVYMAADNTLTMDGLKDIDEMEFNGRNPDVQVVMQGEFSGSQLGLNGTSPASHNLPNLNTFRYAIPPAGGVATSYGPNGTVQDIGNVDMTNPATLRGFVQWAAQNYPAERTALVLWNHGSGYQGLIEDVTSAGSRFMPLSDLQAALSGTTVDVLNFDMCLMAGYETLQKLQGLARTVVFSQELEPGAGNPYDMILASWYTQPTMTAQQAATMIVDRYHASYSGDRASTTLSAFDMSGFSAFEAAFSTLATSLRTGIATYRPTLAAFLQTSQRYEMPQLADIGDVVDSLSARIVDPTLRAQLTSVRSALTSPAFRLRSAVRTGTSPYTNNVTRSTGLNVLLPTGTAVDRLPDSGPGSFTAYRAQWGSTSWSTFLETWLTAAQTAAFTDLGLTRWELYVVWDTASVRRGADVDMWVLEPNGNIYIPYVGTVSPNGHFTGDSYASRTYYEGYMMNRYVQTGRYRFYADLWEDPSDARPVVDFRYRSTAGATFTSLFAPNYPQLSRQTSWRIDPNVTFPKIEAGQYTDIKYLAFLDIAANLVASVEAVSLQAGASLADESAGSAGQTVKPTTKQWAAMQRVREMRLRQRGVERRAHSVIDLLPPPSVR